MIKVGLTGGIASGKTIVASFFRNLGVPVYFSDNRAKALMLKAPIKDKLIDLLGNDVYLEDKVLNKPYISSMIFNNIALLQKVNSIVHPVVQKDFDLFCKENSKEKYIIKESAILIETGIIKHLDKAILVTANKDIRVRRVSLRDGLSDKDIYLKMSKQLEDSQKKIFADFIIENNNKSFIIPEILKIHNVLIN